MDINLLPTPPYLHCLLSWYVKCVLFIIQVITHADLLMGPLTNYFFIVICYKTAVLTAQISPLTEKLMQNVILLTTPFVLIYLDICYQFRILRNLRIDIKDRLEEYSQSIEIDIHACTQSQKKLITPSLRFGYALFLISYSIVCYQINECEGMS